MADTDATAGPSIGGDVARFVAALAPAEAPEAVVLAYGRRSPTCWR